MYHLQVIKNAIKAMEIGDERFSSSQAIRQWITKHHPGRFSKEQVQGGLRALVEKGQLIHDRHSYRHAFFPPASLSTLFPKPTPTEP